MIIPPPLPWYQQSVETWMYVLYTVPKQTPEKNNAVPQPLHFAGNMSLDRNHINPELIMDRMHHKT